MKKKRLREVINKKHKFVILAEFVPLPGHRLNNFEKFLTGYAQKKSELPDDMELAGVTIPQSPSGVASMSPTDIYALLDRKNLWDDLDMVPHVTTKDMNLDAVKSYLIGLQQMGLESVLALTGDKPSESKGVFEVDSIGLIEFMTEMNQQAFAKAKPGAFDKVPQFYIAAAVSPFKYTEAAQMQQYYKMAKKVRAGAKCLITQMGWDWRKSEEMFRYLQEENIDVPIFGNVYYLTTLTPAPRLMFEGKLPGCVVTQELFDKLASESPAQHLDRAAQQVAMYRDLGAAGVDLGGIFDFDMLLEIVTKARQIGSNWRDYQDNLDFGVKTHSDGKEGFYLYQQNGKRQELSRPSPTMSKRSFDIFHNVFLEPGRGLHGTLRRTLGLSKGMRAGKGALYKTFFCGFEKPIKSMMFGCEECGDCFLVENFGICSMGKCEKGLDNPPCGDAEPDGTCGNNPDIKCVGELIYYAAASEGPAGLEKLARTINPARNPSLEGTASILNYLFGKDHTKKVNLIQIGDALHSSNLQAASALLELYQKGPAALEESSPTLDYLIAMIAAQVAHRADYILLNMDAFGNNDPQLPLRLMKYYIPLVKRHSRSIPICIDSIQKDVLQAGLEEWYKDSISDLAPPLLSALTPSSLAELLPLRENYPCRVVIRLWQDKDIDLTETFSINNLYNNARRAFELATSKYGYKPGDIFFQIPVCPLMDDMPNTPSAPSRTHQTFNALRKIMSDRTMKGVHTLLNLSESVMDIPGRRIGVCRAYLDKAIQYHLDAAVVNVMDDYGLKPTAGDLLDLVDAVASQDGTDTAVHRARGLMDKFIQANPKKSPKKKS